MEIGASSVLDMWDLFYEYIPAGKRNDAAMKFLKLFSDQDIDSEEFNEIRGEDEYLDNALDAIYGVIDSESDFDEEYEE